MSRPLPHSAPTDLARTMRESCARMVEDAAAAGLLAPLYLLIARAVAALFGRLANIFELWQAGALPLPQPAPPRARAPRASRRSARTRHNRVRRAPRRLVRARVRARPRPILARHLSVAKAPPVSRPVDRYPKR